MKHGIAALVALGVGVAAWRIYFGQTGKNSVLDVMTTNTNLLLNSGSPVAGMDISAAGIDAIATREGFSGVSYPDASGRSIGYGHFILAGESFTDPMTQAKARELLIADAGKATDAVRAYVKVQLSQNMFDALVSFVYNVGSGAFKKSTLLRLLNAGDYQGAYMQFDQWHKPAIVIGRRDSEKQQFLA